MACLQLHRGSNLSLARETGGRTVRCGTTNSCHDCKALLLLLLLLLLLTNNVSSAVANTWTFTFTFTLLYLLEALASSATARQLQDRHAGSSVSVRPRPGLLGWWLPTRHRRRCQTTVEHWSSVAHKALLATEHLLRQHLGYGTVCRLI